MAAEGVPVYTPRQMFTPPPEPEGWIGLAAQWIRELTGKNPKEVAPNTISGRLIIRQGPQWAQRIGVGRALEGSLDTPEARELRTVFQSGTAISLAAWGGFERFRTFQEVLRRSGGGRYVAGLPPNEYHFLASSDHEAYRLALSWCTEQRKEEIQQTREEARRWRDQVAATSRIIVDVYELLLRAQGLLLTVNNDVVVWENGAHGLYVCEAKNWCYGLECSPEIAVAYYLLALKDRGEQAAQVSRETALPLLTEKVKGWKRTGERTFAWDGGSIDEQGVIMHRRTPVGRVVIEEVHKGGRTVRRVAVRGRGNKVLDEGVLSISPANSKIAPLDEGFQELAIAWGVHRAMERLSEKERDEES